MAAAITVLLAEDHELVRAGIRALLQRLADVDVVAEAADGREALRLVEQHRPQIALIDVAMSGMNGIEATSRIVKDFPCTRVIILSMYSAEEYVAQALAAGAAGYLIKGSAAGELEIAVRAVARGDTYLSPAVSKHLVAALERGGAPGLAAAVLTPRQREILQLVAEGKSSKEIARLLDLSVKTVESHRAELMDRLDIHDVAGLVRYAIRTGIVSPEQ